MKLTYYAKDKQNNKYKNDRGSPKRLEYGSKEFTSIYLELQQTKYKNHHDIIENLRSLTEQNLAIIKYTKI